MYRIWRRQAVCPVWDPNLQNIPVRLEQGRLIRKAFVPEEKNSVLLSSDYSQIELRVLAHISGDEHLIDAFKHGADIHTSTAMRVFNIAKTWRCDAERPSQCKKQ